MTTYQAIANTEIQANKPGKTSLFQRLRDNLLAIAEGDSTAPIRMSHNLLDRKIASNSSALTFTGISSTYNVYEFELVGLFPATATNILLAEVSSDSGSTWIAANYVNSLMTITGGTITGGSGSSSYFNLTGNPTFNGSAENTINGTMLLFNPASSTIYKAMKASTTYRTSAPALVGHENFGLLADTAAINAIRFRMNSGNITSGFINMRARRNG